MQLQQKYYTHKAANSDKLVLIANGINYHTFGNDAILLSMFASIPCEYVLIKDGSTIPAQNVTHDKLNTFYHEMVTQGVVLLIVD